MEQGCVRDIWVRWMDNRVVLTNECACCGTTEQVITNRTVYYSILEKTVLYYVRLPFSDTIENYRAPWLKNCELDMFIPSQRVGIEVDTSQHHKHSYSADYYKDMLCTSNGVKLIRIRDRKCKELNDSSTVIPFVYPSPVSLEHAIRSCLLMLGYKVDVDLKRDKPYINEWCNRRLIKELQQTNPELFDLYLCSECQELCGMQIKKKNGFTGNRRISA